MLSSIVEGILVGVFPGLLAVNCVGHECRASLWDAAATTESVIAERIERAGIDSDWKSASPASGSSVL